MLQVKYKSSTGVRVAFCVWKWHAALLLLNKSLAGCFYKHLDNLVSFTGLPSWFRIVVLLYNRFIYLGYLISSLNRKNVHRFCEHSERKHWNCFVISWWDINGGNKLWTVPFIRAYKGRNMFIRKCKAINGRHKGHNKKQRWYKHIYLLPNIKISQILLVLSINKHIQRALFCVSLNYKQ